jgi:hypothetical protein
MHLEDDLLILNLHICPFTVSVDVTPTSSCTSKLYLPWRYGTRMKVDFPHFSRHSNILLTILG